MKMSSFSDAPQRIRMEMVRCGYTLDRLSEDTEVSKAVLQGILASRASSISTRTLLALSRAFGYELNEFIDLLSESKSER